MGDWGRAGFSAGETHEIAPQGSALGAHFSYIPEPFANQMRNSGVIEAPFCIPRHRFPVCFYRQVGISTGPLTKFLTLTPSF
ncbi:MAG: hypothetical protein ACK559_32940, partial [bacterium]